MTLLGTFALWTALLLSVWGAAFGFAGGWKTRPDLARTITRSVHAVFVCLLVAALALWKGLITHDFNIEYVAAYTSRNLPGYYVFSAFWAGQKGSLLLWAFVLAAFASLAQLLTPRRHADMLPYVAAVTSATQAFFVLTMVAAANPFDRLPYTPFDGRGLNPQLQNVFMTIHPPMLYLGYISTTIPFAFAVAALLHGRLDTGWIHAIRKWTITSWIFLSVAITLGMAWAYVELGWGGYWAWDPVENASFLPWCTMTAFLHSVMIQEKRGMLKRWNVALVAGSFFLTIFGTFITRSGVIQSVHSFAQSNVGTWFLGFLIVSGILTYTLLYVRWPRLEPEVPLESMVSREAAFLFNNLILVGIAFSVLWGTLFPILSEWVRGTKITVGVPFFNRVNAPLGLALLALTGIGPLIAWRKASVANLQRQFIAPVLTGLVTLAALLAAGMRDWYALTSFALAAFTLGTIVQEYGRGVRARMRMHGEAIGTALVRLVARNRRRYGGYLVHVGVLLYFVAFAGQVFVQQQEATLKPGESVTLRSPFGYDYTFTHLGISQFKQMNRMVSKASTRITRDGKPEGIMNSEKRQHFTTDASGNEVPSFEPSTEIGLRSSLREDIYIVFAGAVRGADGLPSEEATYRFNINPLVQWVWIGCAFLLVGGVITMWPGAGATALATERRGEGGYRVAMAGSAS